jgi:hypothetical protein
MGIKEFAWKTTAFIILPALLIYVKSCVNDRVARDQAVCRTCMQALRDTTLTAITLIGPTDSVYPNEHIVQKRLTTPTILQKLPSVVVALRPARVDIGTYRSSPTYRLILTQGPLSCEMRLYRTQAGQQILRSSLDSVYLDDSHRFYPFIDSLFQHTAAAQPF